MAQSSVEVRVIGALEELMDQPLDMSATAADADVDSLTVMEWVFMVEEIFDVRIDEPTLGTLGREATIGSMTKALVTAIDGRIPG